MHHKQAALPAHREQQQQQREDLAHWSACERDLELAPGEVQLRGQTSRVQYGASQIEARNEDNDQHHPNPYTSGNVAPRGPAPLMQMPGDGQQAPLYPSREQANLVHSSAGATDHSETPSGRHMASAGLAHSTSALAHDTYAGGMSSDSELSSRHHHQRPYSSQSRAYHAHPAPRSSHASSRLSHQSEPAATSYSAAKQQRASADQLAYLVQQPRAGRHLPHRPFEQSMSTDHHPVGLYQQQASPARQLPQLLHYDAEQGYGQAANQHQDYQNRYERALNLKLELEMMEKRAAGMSLVGAGDKPTGANIGGQSSAALPPAAGRAPGGRQLPPLASQAVSSHSVDQVVQLDQLQTMARNPDLYPAHQHQADWLPPMGAAQQPQQQHYSRAAAGPFKHAMSIDHYPMSQQPQQQQRHYSPGRSAHFGEHYRSSPVAGYDAQSQQLPPSGADLHGDSSGYHHYSQSHLQQHQQYSLAEQQQQRKQQLESVHQYSSLGMAHPLTKPMSQQANLPRQVSSSSSNNSQSGSLRSSNIDINKSVLDEHQAAYNLHGSPQHKQPPAATYGQSQAQQQQHRAMTRKGFTSLASNLGASSATLHESAEVGAGHAHSPSYGTTKRCAALRASSPMAELVTSSSHYSKQAHHSARDTAPAEGCGTRSESSTGLPNGLGGAGSNSTLTKKSNSATQLSMTGTKKRLGFRKKQVTSFSVHRSEEVAPPDARHLVKQGSSVSEGESSLSGDSSSRSWSNSNSNFKQQTPDELASMSFIDGLGKGQMISRQGLASPYLGDIQLSLCDRRGNLEVEVIRARNLQAKANKILPLTYVKLYLVKNRKCLAKAKTTLCNKRTLDPLFQQQLSFHEDYHGSILQSIVWGNFGKMDKKNFMGIAQISIDDLDLSDTVISWYKLFLPSSLQTLPSKSLRHTLLSNSTESFTNTNNS